MREVLEEVGYDCSHQINADEYIEMQWQQQACACVHIEQHIRTGRATAQFCCTSHELLGLKGAHERYVKTCPWEAGTAAL